VRAVAHRLLDTQGMRFAYVLAFLSGCLYWEQGHGGVCNKAETDGAPALSLMNPDTLQCQTFGIGGVCDPTCGPCPAGDGIDMPTWGACAAVCNGLDEPHCLAQPSCRPARDWSQYYTSAASDYIGCFPDDMFVDTSRTPCAGRNAQACTQSTLCTALYVQTPSDQFKECIPKDQAAGSCTGAITCKSVKPTCPTSTIAGVKDGCWTGACIPAQFCPGAGG
jgi:hypothetical protein